LGVKRGEFRHVFLFENFVVKVPRYDNRERGIISNKLEMEWSAKGRELCPIVDAHPGGNWIVMPRCCPLAPSDEFDYLTFADHIYPMPPIEPGRRNYGWFDNRIVCFDYGLIA
jgi:hypothetical protein